MLILVRTDVDIETDTGTDTDSDAGAGTHTDTGADTGTDIGTDTCHYSGTHAGTDTYNYTGTGTDTGGQVGAVFVYTRCVPHPPHPTRLSPPSSRLLGVSAGWSWATGDWSWRYRRLLGLGGQSDSLLGRHVPAQVPPLPQVRRRAGHSFLFLCFLLPIQ